MLLKQIVIAALALSTASLSHAAAVGALNCSGGQGNVSMNVSYFNIGATLSQPASTNATAQNALMPLDIHAALISFSTLFQAVVGGAPYSSCTLTTQGASGGNITFTFHTVYVSTMNAVASSATSATPKNTYVDAALLYGSVEVNQGGNTIDDGGTTLPPSWDVGVNKTA